MSDVVAEVPTVTRPSRLTRRAGYGRDLTRLDVGNPPLQLPRSGMQHRAGYREDEESGVEDLFTPNPEEPYRDGEPATMGRRRRWPSPLGRATASTGSRPSTARRARCASTSCAD